MPRAQWSLDLEKIERELDPAHRFVDVAIQFRVMRCSCGRPHIPQSSDLAAVRRHLDELAKVEHRPVPDRILPKVYGGRYDTLLGRYVGDPDPTAVRLVDCHEGQVPLITFDEPDIIRLVAIGTPGAGKSRCAMCRGLRNAIERANSIGALIAPTNKGRLRLWKEFLELLEGHGLVQDVIKSENQIVLKNRSNILVLAAKSSGAQYGSPLQGYSLDWAVPDETQNIDDDAHDEITARGRNAGSKYFIMETATNIGSPSWRLRRERLKTNKQCKLERFHGFANPWVDPDWWKKLLAEYTDRKYKEYILAEEVPPELLVYPTFSYAETIRPRPNLLGTGWQDITAQLALEKFQREGVQFLVGQDFGVLTNASVIFKVYQSPQGERCWWAVDEVTSQAGTTADIHARMLLQTYASEQLAVVADPHFNTKDHDKSDYNLFRREGIWIRPAADGQIARETRIGIVCRLLGERDPLGKVGRRRLFIDCDSNRNPVCPKLAQAFVGLQRNELGQAERDKKDATDQTHWPAAVGYLVYPWERVPFTAVPAPVASHSNRLVRQFGKPNGTGNSGRRSR
jgi:hypothetical protein